jgi:Terminase large subunit, T4likevirus-type, N-terminal
MNPTNKQSAVVEAWRRGFLSWKLDSFQKDLEQRLLNSPEKINVVLCGRRIGKSYFSTVLAIQQCLKKPKSIVKFLAQTKLQIESILRPLFEAVLIDCPEQIKPQLNRNRFAYFFPNGSVIELAGSDGGHAEKLRGSFADLIIVDEAGMCTDLQNTVRSILIPTTLNTKGKIILLSTPPRDSEHDFFKFVEESERKKVLIRARTSDNPRITKEEFEEIIKAYPMGENDPEFRREFYCELLKDPSSSAIPEFTEDLEKDIIKEFPRPPFFETYESMDLGGKDLTVVLFGYYDFRSGKVIIEDELVMDFAKKDNNISKLIEQIREKEAKNWMTLSGEVKKPYLRVSDINYIVTNEILKESNNEINFQITKKDDKDAAINNLRVMLGSKKIIIHPRCETLIYHLRNVKWAKNKREFARSVEMGHYDAVDALIYMVRSINYTKNPYPMNYDLNMKDLFIVNPKKFGSSQTPMSDVYKKIFNVKR